jgi:hypothetical protein
MAGNRRSHVPLLWSHVENNPRAQDLVAALILKLAYSARRVAGVEKSGSHSAAGAIDTSQSFAVIAFNLACYASVRGRVEEAKVRLRHCH